MSCVTSHLCCEIIASLDSMTFSRFSHTLPRIHPFYRENKKYLKCDISIKKQSKKFAPQGIFD
jgi:hypothetical protein